VIDQAVIDQIAPTDEHQVGALLMTVSSMSRDNYILLTTGLRTDRDGYCYREWRVGTQMARGERRYYHRARNTSRLSLIEALGHAHDQLAREPYWRSAVGIQLAIPVGDFPFPMKVKK
jgi:hypothetical protein